MQDEINLFDYLIVVLRRKRLVAGVTVSIAVLALVIGMLIPPVYVAETKILPPQSGGSSIASALLNQFASTPIMAGALDMKTVNGIYMEMLRSRTVLDAIIERFGLMSEYKARYREDVRQRLAKEVLKTGSDRSGIITIGIRDKDPVRAARMANAFVEELKNLNKGLAMGEASRRRLFFEEQLKEAKACLIKSEESLRGFQEKTGAFKMDEQAKAVIEGIAQLRAQIAGKEVALKVMRTYATRQNPDLQKAEEEVSGLRTELAKLETAGGRTVNVSLQPEPASSPRTDPDPFMPANKMPAVGTEYVRKVREFKYNEAVYEILLKQYEAARLDEAKDAPLIQVIEPAGPPDKPVRHSMASITLPGAGAGFLISVAYVFLLEFIRKTPKDRMEALKSHLGFKSRDESSK